MAGLPGGFAGDLMRLYPIQSNDQYPLKVSGTFFRLEKITIIFFQSHISPASNAIITLPYNVKLGKEKKLLEHLFEVEYKTFADFLALSSASVIIKQKRLGEKPQISGLVSCWKVEALQKSGETDLCSRFFGKLLRCPSMGAKYKLVIKIFAASPVILDEDLLDDIFEAFKDTTEAQDVILVANEKNESLVRFLKMRKFEDLKTEFLISGQELLCKTI